MLALDPFDVAWNIIVLTLLCVGFPAVVGLLAYIIERLGG